MAPTTKPTLATALTGLAAQRALPPIMIPGGSKQQQTAPFDKLEERMSRLETSVSEVLGELRAVHSDVQLLRRQNAPAGAVADEEILAARAAQDHIEAMIQATHRNFAQFDSDGNGTIDVSELGSALSALGVHPEGRPATLEDVSEIMRVYDTNGDGSLDEDEFRNFVRDMALNGRLQLNDDLRADCDRIAKAVREDPWATVLRGDAALRAVLDTIRERYAKRSSLNERGASSSSNPRRLSIAFAKGASFDSETQKKLAGVAKRAERQRSSVCGRLSIRCCKCWAMLPVLHPDGGFRSGWNVFMALLIVYCGITVPLEVAFEQTMEIGMGRTGWEVWLGWNLFVDIIFIIDILLNFRTGFVVEGHLVRDTGRIARTYLSGTFFVDLIGSFPLGLILQAMETDGESNTAAAGRLNRQIRLIRIVKLNRLLRLRNLGKKMRNLEMATKFNPSMMRLLRLTLGMLGCCHWLGCLWWFVSDLELDGATIPANDWQPNEALLTSEKLGPQFAAAFFWGAGMVTTFVPYDIMPDTEVERYVTAACMFIGLGLNAVVIGSMSAALQSMDSKKSIAASKLNTIDSYLQMNSVAPELKTRILEFYEYLYTSSQSMEQLRLYQDLPPSLATRLSLTVHRKMIERCPFLTHLSDEQLLGVLGMLKPHIFVPSQIILSQGQRLMEVYYVKKGRVQMLRNLGSADGGDGQLAKLISQYDNFGLDLNAARKSTAGWESASIGMAETYQYARESARAESYCDVMVLALADVSALFAQDRAWGRVVHRYRTEPLARRLSHRVGGVFRRRGSTTRKVAPNSGASSANGSVFGGDDNRSDTSLDGVRTPDTSRDDASVHRGAKLIAPEATPSFRKLASKFASKLRPSTPAAAPAAAPSPADDRSQSVLESARSASPAETATGEVAAPDSARAAPPSAQ